MLLGLLFIVGGLLLYTLFACYMMMGRFPRKVFRPFLSWWWPFRKESPATLLYVAVECMDDELLAKSWQFTPRSGWSNRGVIDCDILKVSIGYPSASGRIAFYMKASKIDVSAWDDYLLCKIFHRVARVKRDASNKEQLRDAARTMLDGMQTVRAHIAELEERAGRLLPPPNTINAHSKSNYFICTRGT